ncbi:hypothetical protein DAPPUDRAFT_322864 [Daphnia pulex]|uniref:Uncharacterized protein n=1 Tax=Daphnia pulex TaxID=6669 RepID=E9GX55_DAPPU|nr:hypothetical protein DAPPUDRAFT_322864 [Daphnia pulex]|eukprot:EFX75921.1 hypothetical protein DAPPUDRAFT_322864 [Daphnia pulex]
MAGTAAKFLTLEQHKMNIVPDQRWPPVIGMDFGNESCFIVERAGGIEVIINDYSQRDTP